MSGDELRRILDGCSIHISLSDDAETLRLRAQISDLTSELQRKQSELDRIQLLYQNECDLNMRLTDLIREHGIRLRLE